jgi:hypothetical protein
MPVVNWRPNPSSDPPAASGAMALTPENQPRRPSSPRRPPPPPPPQTPGSFTVLICRFICPPSNSSLVVRLVNIIGTFDGVDPAISRARAGSLVKATPPLVQDAQVPFSITVRGESISSKVFPDSAACALSSCLAARLAIRWARPGISEQCFTGLMTAAETSFDGA